MGLQIFLKKGYFSRFYCLWQSSYPPIYAVVSSNPEECKLDLGRKFDQVEKLVMCNLIFEGAFKMCNLKEKFYLKLNLIIGVDEGTRLQFRKKLNFGPSVLNLFHPIDPFYSILLKKFL